MNLLYIQLIFYLLYLMYNFRCYNKKVINLWIRDDLLNNNLVPADDIYYEFQYKSSIKSALFLCLLVVFGIIINSMILGFLVPMLLFHFLIDITKKKAIKKGYLIKNSLCS